MRARVSVISAGKVSVVRGNDGILFSFLNVMSLPLTDAWTAGIRQNGSTNLVKNIDDAVSFHSGPNLLGTRCDRKGGFHLQT